MDNDRESVYLETTIPSLATSRLSRDPVMAGRQIVTKNFWEQERHKYEFYISQHVIDECSQGDPEAAQKWLDFIKGIELLPTTEQTIELAGIYQKILGIPEKAKLDCFHLSTSVVSGTIYLLSWNCTHLGVNAYAKVRDYNEKHGLWTPLLITPEALIELSGEEQE
jgi:hypothetical protein